MSDVSPSARAIEAAVASGDRRRRRVAAMQVAARTAPVTALTVTLAALGSRLLALPASVVFLWIAAGLAFIVLAAARAAWRHPVRDAVVRQLDDDANLSGELRSAHWFALATGDTAWSRHHLAAAAERARALAWREIYPFALAGRRWTASAGLVALALAIGYWPARAAVSTAGTTAGTAADPGALAPALVEQLSALANGGLTTEEARELARTILGRPAIDPVLERQLEMLLSLSGQQPSSPADGTADRADGEQAGHGSQTGSEVPDEVEWALGDTAARLANEQARRSTSSLLLPDAKPPDTHTPDADEPVAAGAARPQDGTPRRSARDAGGASGLAIETDEASGDESTEGEGRSSAGSGRTPRGESLMADWELNEALDREVLRASESARGRTLRVDERRRTEERPSALAFTGADPRQRFAAPPIGAAAVVPDARRTLLERYFVREAE